MSDALPHVSIILPTFNRPALLQRSLASVLAQRGVEIEAIVVDDGSEPPASIDGSTGAVLIRTGNRGASAARNAGLARARGEHVMFLDSDDWLEPDAAAALLGTVRASGAALAFGRWRNVHEASGETDVASPPAPYADSLANAVAGGWAPGSFLMRRSVAARFDPALTVWEVVAFEVESLAGGAEAARCEAVVLNVAQHAEPGRITNRYDHFEPLTTARTFGAMKAGLAARGLLNAERTDAFNRRLLPCLHALLRAGRPEAREVYEAIDWVRRPDGGRERPASFAWCARWGGLAGARGFVALNGMLGR